MNKNYFIFTEIVNCGKIGKIAIDSFRKYHHDELIHVFGTVEDFKWIEDSTNIRPHIVHEDIVHAYKQGHLGTAKLWAQLIKERSEDYLIHFDSDIIFRGDILNTIIEKTDDYDLIGATRNYINNPQNDDSYRQYQDVVATGCFAFNKTKIDEFDIETLTSMCRGTFNPLGHPVLDFFDPVSFNILKNGGNIFNLDFNEVGGCNKEGSRDNDYPDLNNMKTQYKIEFGSKMSHFSAVGSGMNFHNNPQTTLNVPQSYRDYAIDRYAVFCRIFYNENIGIDISKYDQLFEDIDWY